MRAISKGMSNRASLKVCGFERYSFYKKKKQPKYHRDKKHIFYMTQFMA